MIRILIGLFLFSSIQSLQAQTLPPDFKADFLSSKIVLVHLNDQLGSKLTFSAIASGGQPCCVNSFTGKEMMNYDFTITVENQTLSSTYFVKMPINGEALATGSNFSSTCSFDHSTYIGIGSDRKTFRLDPGQSKTFKARTKMDYQNYYPITVEQHDDLIAKNPEAFTPQCINFTIFSKVYTQSQIQTILTKIQNAKNAASGSNNNTTANEEKTDFEGFVGEFEDSFEDEIATDAERTAQESSESPNKEAADIILKPKQPEEEEPPAIKYDDAICQSLKREARNFVSEYERLDGTINTADFLKRVNRRQQAVDNNQLDPVCEQEVIAIVVDYLNGKQRQYDQEYNQLMNQYGDILNRLPNNPTSNKPGFQVIPSTMTQDYIKPNPTNKPSKFGNGKTAPIKKKVNY